MKKAAQSTFISTTAGQVHYRRVGSGKNLILALHGFGLTGSMFSAFAQGLDKNAYSCLALDLPGHGQTQWEEAAYSPASFAAVIERFLLLEDWATVHLLGFSLGGRVWSKLISSGHCPKADSLTLVAPDGFRGRYTAWIDGHRGHLLSPVSKLGKHPRPWIWLARQLEKRKIISSFSRQFVEWQLGDPFSRQRLQLTLRSLAQFRLDTKDYNNLAQWAAQTSTQLWAGRQDSIIRLNQIDQILHLHPQIERIIYSGGHQLPSQDLIHKFSELLFRS